MDVAADDLPYLTMIDFSIDVSDSSACWSDLLLY